MIAFIVGTTAELIKIAPVYHEFVSRGRSTEVWYTGQHVNELPAVLADLDLPAPALWLVPERDAKNLARTSQVPGWAFRVFRTAFVRRRELRARLRSDGKMPVVLVHGDTFTTLLGAIVGRLLGAKIGHVEAGMRSGSLLHPFPEEFNRKATALLAHMHFAPSAVEVKNLSRRKGVVLTGGNTAIDAARQALAKNAGTLGADLPEIYGIATLHRFELVRDKDAYGSVLSVLKRYAARTPIIYFAGESEKERLREYDLLSSFDDNFVLRDKARYIEFLPVLARAQFVVTDSGGVQEESAHLGIPCAVHRLKTERQDGAGKTMLLTGMDTALLEVFLDDVERYRSTMNDAVIQPSIVIADAVEQLR